MRASRNNRSCNLLSKPFFTIVRDHSPEFTFVDAGEPFRSGLPASRIHAHVERSVGAKREPARGVVDLGRRDAKVEQRAVDRADALGIQELRQFGEPGTAKAEALIAEGSRGGLRVGITVERDETAARPEPLEDPAAVPAAAEGSVDIGPVDLDRQRGHRFFEEDRDMAAIGHQSEKPSSSGGSPPAGKASDSSVRSSHFCSSHNSNRLPCPTSTMRLSSVAY